MPNATDIIEQAGNVLLKNYKFQSIVMDHAKGCYAYDTEGKRYLDFAAGFAVASLGHAHPKMLKTIREQSEKLIICQASYVTKPKLEAAQILVDNSCFDTVYFSNSGTESVEAAMKCARKWAYDNKSENCNEIIAFKNAFHGRTYGSASITDKRKDQPYFAPYIEGVHFAEFNNVSSVNKLINQNTAAIIIEPVQGEGGLNPAAPVFLADLRKLCDEHNICLIFDEIQAGMGRIGTFFAYQSFETDAGVTEPDIVCLAKGMGSGFPVGAMVAKKEFGESLGAGTHGTTYGGNPLACAVAATVMSEILSDGFLENANKVSEHLLKGLRKIQSTYDNISEIRGRGLMIGLDTTLPIKELLLTLRDNGLMATQAGKSILRLTPPLIVSIENADEAIEIIDKTLKDMS